MCHSSVMKQDNSTKTEESMMISYSSPRYPLYSAQCLDKKREWEQIQPMAMCHWLSACTAEEYKVLSIKFEDAASRNPTKMRKKFPENMTWLAHCYSQLTFFHMGWIYCTTCKSYGCFTEFFLCAKVAQHLLKSPAVSLGCCWTCLARYSESVVN